MAWNAWNTFSSNGKPLRGGRKEYQTIADAMVESGMVAAGYTVLSTVCTDWIGRDPVTHELLQNTTLWPGGMASFSEYLHGKGMQLSVYTDAGHLNCCQEPGSLGYEALDMKTFASWGVDAVGVDYCGGPPGVEPEYQKFADGIVESGRGMALGMWNLGRGQAYQWAPSMSVNMTAGLNGAWIPHMRMTPDIGNYWDGNIPPTMSVMATVDAIQGIPDLWSYGMGNRSGTFPNYGQMTVGVPKDHPTIGDPGLTLIEAQSHFSLWCMFAAMLMATNDVRRRDPAIERILLNPETIAINQDPWGIPAFRISDISGKCGGEQWARKLANGDIAVLVLNRADTAMNTTVAFDEFLNRTFADAAPATYNVRDVQARVDLGPTCGLLSFSLAPHQTAFVRLSVASAYSCTPSPEPPCTIPPLPPAPPAPPPPSPPMPPGCWHQQPCRACADGSKPCQFPVPALPPCPDGFATYASGYWANPDQRSSTGHPNTVAGCGAVCSAEMDCKGFSVYDPAMVTEPAARGGSACYTYSTTLAKFVDDKRGLIRACVKSSVQIAAASQS